MFSGMASLSAVVGAVADGDGRQPAGRRDRRGRSASRSGSDRWLIAASVPTLCAMALLPLRPLLAHRPGGHGDARGAGRRAEGAGGARPAHAAHEKIVLAVLRRAWSCSGARRRRSGSTRRRSRFSGSASLLATGVLTLDDIAKEGDVLATFIWFAVLFTLSSQLNELGFMAFLGERLAAALDGLSPLPTAG